MSLDEAIEHRLVLDPIGVPGNWDQKQVERTGNYAALFRAHSIRCAFVPTGTIVAARLQHDGWVTRYADAQWRVLVAP